MLFTIAHEKGTVQMLVDILIGLAITTILVLCLAVVTYARENGGIRGILAGITEGDSDTEEYDDDDDDDDDYDEDEDDEDDEDDDDDDDDYEPDDDDDYEGSFAEIGADIHRPVFGPLTFEAADIRLRTHAPHLFKDDWAEVTRREFSLIAAQWAMEEDNYQREMGIGVYAT